MQDTSSTTESTATARMSARAYTTFLLALQAVFLERVGSETNRPLFATAITGLYDLFLDSLLPTERQTYNCRTCRNFVERYGNLVTIDDEGNTQSAFWEPAHAPAFFAEAVTKMAKAVSKAPISGVFLYAHESLGVRATPDTEKDTVWHHMSVPFPEHMRAKLRLLAIATPRTPEVYETPDQAMAERKAEYEMLTNALHEFTPNAMRTAYTALKTGVLYRAEKAEERAKWLLDLQQQRERVQDMRQRRNLVWRAAAQAPTGFAHVKSGMLGTLLEDIDSGMPMEQVAVRWAAKMDPQKYQRPQAPPKAGAIDQAEKTVAALGLGPSLLRRFARLEDVTESVWSPPPPPPPKEPRALFSHLRPAAKAENRTQMPEQTMTWIKFEKTVLPEATLIEGYVPHGTVSLVSLVTAVNPDAPPLLQWDRPEKRNPVSWFFYGMGGVPQDWGLRGGEFYAVTRLIHYPHMWNGGGFDNQGKGVIFLLQGAHDIRGGNCACLFPEILRGELHGVRAVIEAHSKATRLAEKERAECSGLSLKEGKVGSITRVRVFTEHTITVYNLDRWD